MKEIITTKTRYARIIGKVSHEIIKSLPEVATTPAKVIGFCPAVVRQARQLARLERVRERYESKQRSSNLARLTSLKNGELTYQPFSGLLSR